MGEYPREARDRLLLEVARMLAAHAVVADQRWIMSIISDAEMEIADERAAEEEPCRG